MYAILFISARLTHMFVTSCWDGKRCLATSCHPENQPELVCWQAPRIESSVQGVLRPRVGTQLLPPCSIDQSKSGPIQAGECRNKPHLLMEQLPRHVAKGQDYIKWQRIAANSTGRQRQGLEYRVQVRESQQLGALCHPQTSCKSKSQSEHLQQPEELKLLLVCAG